MPRRSVSVVLPAIAALGVGGAWAGTGLGALPPPPTGSLPTVTVPLPPPPPLPIPLPPPPAVTVPPKVEAPPVSTPPQPVDPPVAVSPAAAPPSVPPGLRGGGASSVYYRSRAPIRRQQVPKLAKLRTAAPVKKRDAFVRAASPARAVQAAKGVKGASASVQGPVPEDAGFFGPIGSALGTLDIPREVIPPALFAMAALAILLLTLASTPLPARTSRTSAMLVHMRGSIAVAGTAALMMALATYFLL